MSTSTGVEFKRIVVAFDGSDNALRACEVAAVIARAYGSRVTVLYAIPTLSMFTAPLVDQYYALQLTAANSQIKKVASLLKREGVKLTGEVLQARASIVNTIIEYADGIKSDLMVMGTRGLGGFKKMLVGSVSSGVVAHAHCPVLVVRPGPSREKLQLGSILVAVDGSESALKAVRVAVGMAKTLAAELTILHVIHVPSVAYSASMPIPIDKIYWEAREYGDELVSEAGSLAEENGVEAKKKVMNNIVSPARGITEYAQKNKIDLIVVGTRGLGGFRKLLLGSVASGVVNYASCSVLVVR